MAILEEISTLLQAGRAPKVKAAVQQALDEGVAPKEILENGLLAGMGIIGEKFRNGEVFVPEVLVAARAMNKGVEVLKPHMSSGDVEDRGTAIIGLSFKALYWSIRCRSIWLRRLVGCLSSLKTMVRK